MKSCSVTTCVVAVALVLAACLCVALIAFGALAISAVSLPGGDITVNLGSTSTPTPQILRPAATPDVPLVVSTETLETLQNAVVPENDPAALAERLAGSGVVPETLEAPAAPRRVGDQDFFWATNTDTAESFRISATLRFITPHLYFWVEDGVDYQEDALAALSEEFETHIYPTVREFFGSEWSPGVDGDPHLYILYARGLGLSIAGYFSSSDEVHPLAHEYSNAHEMFFLSADNVALDEEFTYGVLAHEFQHMVHWNGDRNEESWMNEGFSEVAAFLTGYDQGGFDYVYTSDPDLQLNTWPGGNADTTPHYGGAFLFLTYFLDRYGEDATQALVANPNNGMTSIDLVLAGLGQADPRRGRVPGAEDVFQDWTLASYLQNPAVADGRFVYHNYPDAPAPNDTETLRSCPAGKTARDVHQYGVDYIRITCRGDFNLHFEGSTLVRLLPVEPHSGQYAFWSNRGDESDMTLTRLFDFSAQEGPLTLDFWMWYDLEEDYDYVYLQASSDGENWQIISTPGGTGSDPSGNSYGWAYNGQTHGWRQESVDISQFAGQQVYLRFEYITDAAVNGEGFLLDDVQVPEIGYLEDFEAGEGGWEGAGFVRIENLLPQSFRLALITQGENGPQVEYIALNPDNSADIPLSIGGDVEEVVLVVSGVTRFTRQKAVYQLEIGP